MRYLSDISLRHSWDFDTLFPNNSEFFYVYQSVSSLLQGWSDSTYSCQNQCVFYYQIFTPASFIRLSQPCIRFALGRKKEHHSRGQRPPILWFEWTWKFSQSSGGTVEAPTTARDHLLGRWVTGSRNSDVDWLSPEAKATAGQTLFLSALDVAKIRLSSGRNEILDFWQVIKNLRDQLAHV